MKQRKALFKSVSPSRGIASEYPIFGHKLAGNQGERALGWLPAWEQQCGPGGTAPVTKPAARAALKRCEYYWMKSASALSIAAFGRAPTMVWTTLPPWNTDMVGIDMIW